MVYHQWVMITHITLLELFKSRVRDGWAELINRYPWEWFVTLTFITNIHPEAALKAMKHWINLLNVELYGRRWRKKPPYGVYWAACIEYQLRGVIHLHLLMAGVQNARRLTYMDTWLNLGNKNGFARVEPVQSQTKASNYLCKYVVKDGDIYLSDNLPDVTAGFGRVWLGPTSTTEPSAAEPSAAAE